jgi:hypothetical protein
MIASAAAEPTDAYAAALAEYCRDRSEAALYHLWQGRGQERLIAYRGIVGVAIPRVRAFSFALAPEWLLLIHTDGVRGRFQADSLPGHLRADPHALAENILHTWARSTDDATVVVAQPFA